MSDDKPYGYAFVMLGKCDRILVFWEGVRCLTTSLTATHLLLMR
ncbi:MAG: hypothetical protein V7K69_20105 [Nostoc sp.]